MNNAIVVQVSLEIHTLDAVNHQDLYANQIHVHQTVNASFKKMVNQFASVHLGWEAIQQQLDVMDMNAVPIMIVPNIMHV